MDARKHKHKKHKKEKKSKREKKKYESDSDSDDSSEWVEAASTSSSPKRKRDEWMDDDSFVPTYEKSDLGRKSRKKQELEEKEAREKKILAERELNPYYRNKGKGLPDSATEIGEESRSLPSSSVGDGGYSWLKKAYQRAKEQAAKDNRTVEDVVSERWGSLEALESMLQKAKDRMLERQRSDSPSSSRHSRKYYEREESTSKKEEAYHSSKQRDKERDYQPYQRYKQDKGDSEDCNTSYRKPSRRSPSGDRRYTHPEKNTFQEKESRSSKFMTPSDDFDDRNKRDFKQSSSQHIPSWKKQSSSREFVHPKDVVAEVEKKSSDDESSKHHSKDYDTSYRKPSHRSPSGDRRYTYREKNTFEEKESRSSKFKAPSDEFDDKNKRDFKQSSSQHTPSWKKQSSSREFVQPKTVAAEVVEKNSDGESNKHPRKQHSNGKDRESEKKEPSDSEDSSEDDPKERQINASKLIEELVLNQNEMNYLGARLLRAKLEGDSNLASKIQQDFNLAKNKRTEFLQSGGKVEESWPRDEVIDSLVDFYPLPKGLRSKIKKRKRQRNRNVYVGPMRRKGFDKNSSSMSNIYERERMSTIDDQMRMYFTAASTCQESLNNECDEDVSGEIEKKMNSYPSQERDMQKAIFDHKKLEAALKKCRFCWDQPNLLKHTVVAKGNSVFLCVPSYQSLVEGHCFIVPLNHVPSILHLDEDEFKEIQNFKRALEKMASDSGQCMIFMETSYRFKSQPHAVIECIPMPRETGELAPLYFKKAIDESEHEWAQNKKLIDLSKKGFRHSVPKGLPYFSVEFGLQGGYAHIIEDEKQFPPYFGKEIIGGILEIETMHIIKMKPEATEDICKKTVKMVKLWWKKYKHYV